MYCSVEGSCGEPGDECREGHIWDETEELCIGKVATTENYNLTNCSDIPFID